ncbi:unnamed protein product [Rhizopus microsporus]
MSNKRSRSPSIIADNSEKRPCTDQNNLLTELTHVLNQINSTPSSRLNNYQLITIKKQKLVKYESDRCLESWFDDLLERCGDELDWDDLALALALEEEEEEDIVKVVQEEEEEDEDEEIIIVDDEDTPVQRLAVS